MTSIRALCLTLKTIVHMFSPDWCCSKSKGVSIPFKGTGRLLVVAEPWVRTRVECQGMYTQETPTPVTSSIHSTRSRELTGQDPSERVTHVDEWEDLGSYSPQWKRLVTPTR